MTEIKLDIQPNVLLRDYTTMKVGGKADELVVAHSTVELVQAISYALEHKLPYFILGGGSNVIISDRGFRGLVIKNEAREVLIDEQHSIVQADSGVPSGKVASMAASAGLSGAEYLFGIPGSIGGAVYGNAGLRGHETKDIVKDVVMMLVKDDGKPVIVKKSREWFEYQYRDSLLKQMSRNGDNNQRPVILTVRLQLYPARQEVIMERTREFLGHRRGGTIAGTDQQHAWQPTGLRCAGCIFRNPDPTDPERAAGKLLDMAGVKRMTVGGAAVAKEHANYIYNKNNATAQDLFTLIQQARAKVKAQADVDLALEVELVGEFDE
ncbi:MAG: UDP-N-acetylmuramate dehydrogenase [bacterium]|nr:UDP-N-acetylmuramate dehydrogenase [bacterium]